MAKVVKRCVEIKAKLAGEDEKDLKGKRALLNFGHTVAHGLEGILGYDGLRHGEAVAIGMVAEARLAVRLGLAAAAVPERIIEVVRAAGLPSALPLSLDRSALLGATRQDKKARAGMTRFALPAAIGQMAGADQGYGIPVEEAAVLQILTEM